MEQKQIDNRWKEIEGGIRNLWGLISVDELDSLKGNLAGVTEAVHQKYGESKESIHQKLNHLLATYENELPNESSFERAPHPEEENSQLSSLSQGKFGETDIAASDGQDHSLESFGAYDHEDYEAKKIKPSENAHQVNRSRDNNSDLSDVKFQGGR